MKNIAGEMIGVMVAGYRNGQNIDKAMPEAAKRLFAEIIADYARKNKIRYSEAARVAKNLAHADTGHLSDDEESMINRQFVQGHYLNLNS